MPFEHAEAWKQARPEAWPVSSNSAKHRRAVRSDTGIDREVVSLFPDATRRWGAQARRDDRAFAKRLLRCLNEWELSSDAPPQNSRRAPATRRAVHWLPRSFTHVGHRQTSLAVAGADRIALQGVGEGKGAHRGAYMALRDGRVLAEQERASDDPRHSRRLPDAIDGPPGPRPTLTGLVPRDVMAAPSAGAEAGSLLAPEPRGQRRGRPG